MKIPSTNFFDSYLHSTNIRTNQECFLKKHFERKIGSISSYTFVSTPFLVIYRPQSRCLPIFIWFLCMHLQWYCRFPFSKVMTVMNSLIFYKYCKDQQSKIWKILQEYSKISEILEWVLNIQFLHFFKMNFVR